MLTVDPTLFQETSNANDGKLRRERPKFVNKSPLIFSLNFAFFSFIFLFLVSSLIPFRISKWCFEQLW